MTHPPTSTNVAADTADERVGSAYKAVGSSLGAAARGVGSLFRRDKGQPDDDPSASTSRARRSRSDDELAETGTPMRGLIALAALLVVGGAALTFARRDSRS